VGARPLLSITNQESTINNDSPIRDLQSEIKASSASAQRPGLQPLFEDAFARLPRATFARPAVKLSPNNLGLLRSVAGLTVSSAGSGASQQLHKTALFSVPLTGKEETARGIWIRQATVDNPD